MLMQSLRAAPYLLRISPYQNFFQHFFGKKKKKTVTTEPDLTNTQFVLPLEVGLVFNSSSNSYSGGWGRKQEEGEKKKKNRKKKRKRCFE